MKNVTASLDFNLQFVKLQNFEASWILFNNFISVGLKKYYCKQFLVEVVASYQSQSNVHRFISMLLILLANSKVEKYLPTIAGWSSET